LCDGYYYAVYANNNGIGGLDVAGQPIKVQSKNGENQIKKMDSLAKV